MERERPLDGDGRQHVSAAKTAKARELCLGMTHEEVMTDIARKELRSYKQLPQIWYQIQTKFRDEPRPKAGLLRVRQFIMKDSYSFDIDDAGLDKSYNQHDIAYRRIFDRCGLKYVAVEADSGAMGGSQSQEFMVYTDAGEDLIVSCPNGDYAANIEKATSLLLVEGPCADRRWTAGAGAYSRQRRDCRCGGVLAGFSKAGHQDALLTCSCAAGKWLPLAVFLRGDHSVNESKLSALVGAVELRPMVAEELETWFQRALQDISGRLASRSRRTLQSEGLIVVLDKALADRKNMICGANKLDYHFRNVTPKRDFQWTVVADIRNVAEGEGCPVCGAPLKVAKAVEIGHIFKLGYKYTGVMGSSVLDENGKEVKPIMGCYGIGIERILTASIEQNQRQERLLAASGDRSF